jgi:aldehyde dehydrogenase (NAD+)
MTHARHSPDAPDSMQPFANFSDLVQRQREFFHSGATRPLEFRRAQLHKLRDALVANEAALLDALRADLGKSPHEAYISEVGFLLSDIQHALRHLPGWLKPQRRQTPLVAWPARGFVIPEPFGVALIIGAWNYPLQLLLCPLVGAIAAGNCAVLKPSEFAPHTAAAVAELFRTNFARDFLAVVPGDREVGESLLRERFGKIFFTGSTNVGRAVMAAAASHLSPVTLELGGKCPCLVCADAPLPVTARRIAWGKFLNAGQTCVAPDFVLVDRRIHDGLLQSLKQALREFYGEDSHQSPDYSRIVNNRHFDRLAGYLGTGRVVHGGRHERSDLHFEPTLLTDVPLDAPVMQEEIFGPILPVLSFDKLDDALSLLQNRPTPLALYLFSGDRATQDRVLAATRSGGVCLNDTITHMVGKNLPFGGLGDSGLGAYHGKASFDAFTHYRTVMRRSFAFDSKLRYPPPRISLTALKRACRFLLGG